MKIKLDEALVRDFPELYQARHADMQTTSMCWGFECGSGWEPIIRTLSERLTNLSNLEGVHCVAVQVKEKFGTLRFYIDKSTDLMDAVIELAEKISAITCELCGNSGKLGGKGWISVRCEKCKERETATKTS
jgi:hypothetical protein